MKKLLALVLAMVMTLGLATVSTNAVDKFADNDSIKFTEAATVMKAIGVFDGDDSGNFRPTETLKRSEAAKIVAYLMLTKKTADGLVPSGTRYVDVPANHWAAGYIEYLTSEGVLGGVGDGKFNPDGDITGIDFAKMLLVALGYDAKLENLVLSDYRINTAKLANSIDLFEGNTDMVPTAAITRDEAVLYAFNMIKSPMVEYDSNVRVETGNGGAVTVGNNRAYQKTSSNRQKQSVLFKQAARNDQLNTATNAQWIVEFAEEKYPDLELVDRNPLDADDRGVGPDSFGRPSRQWLWKNEDLGRFVQTQDLVASWNKEVTAKMLYDQLGKTVYDSLKNGHSFLDSYKNGVAQAVGDINLYLNRDNTTTVNSSGNAVKTELYMDKDKNVTVVTMYTWVYQAAADYNKNSKTLRVTPAGLTGIPLNSNELKLEDFAEIEDYKADDYILAKAIVNSNGRYEIKEIEQAQKVTGKVDAYTTDGTYDVTIDGTKHAYAYTSYKDVNGNTNNDEVRSTMYSVGKDATVITDADGYIFVVDEAIVTSDYVFITKFGSNSNLKSDAVAAAYFTDGTDATIKLKSVYDFTAKKQETGKTNIANWGTTNAAQINKWYTYSKNANGEYTLYNVQKNHTQVASGVKNYTGVTADDVVMYDGQVSYSQYLKAATNNASRADDKTIVVVNDDGKSQVNVYTGVKNIPGISLTKNGARAGIYALNDSKGVAKVVFVDLSGDALVTGSANDNLIYVIKSNGSVRNDDEKNETRWQYKVLKNDGTTDEENILADNSIASYNDHGKYMVANYASKNADGLYTRFYNVSDDNAGSDTVAWGLADGSRWNNNNLAALNKDNAPITYKNGALTVGGQGWTLADDAKITVVGIEEGDSTGGVINTDKAADYEVHAWISGSELNGMFDVLSAYTYDFALRTTGSLSSNGLSNSGRSTVKELFITVWTGTTGSTTAAADTTGLTVKVANGEISVYNTANAVPSEANATAAIESRLASLGYVITGSSVANGKYTYVTINPNGYTETLTYDPTDYTLATDGRNIVVSVDGKYVDAKDTAFTAVLGTYDDAKGTAQVVAGKNVKVDGKYYTAGETVTINRYSVIETGFIKVSVDGKDVYLPAGTETEDSAFSGYKGAGNGWKINNTYVPYTTEDKALVNGDIIESGYVKTVVLGAVGYTKYGESFDTAKNALTKTDSYLVSNNGNETKITDVTEYTIDVVYGDVVISLKHKLPIV